jgi:hypothetical protein
LKQEVASAVNLKGCGQTARFEGKFPSEYSQLIKPSEDLEAYLVVISNALTGNKSMALMHLEVLMHCWGFCFCR